MKLPLRYAAPTIRDADDKAILDMVYGTDAEREANALAIITALTGQPVIPADIYATLSDGLFEAQTEFQGKVNAFNDYSEEEIREQNKAYVKAHNWLDKCQKGGTYLVIEIYSGSMQLEHNAIVTPEELLQHFPDAIISITGTMDNNAAEALTYTERGLAHLDDT